MALNLVLPYPRNDSCNRLDFTTEDSSKEANPIKELLLGQLLFYRHKYENKFRPNIAHDLFSDWRFESGEIFRSTTCALDLEKLRHKSGAWTEPLKDPKARLYIPSGDPIFPLRNDDNHALLFFAD